MPAPVLSSFAAGLYDALTPLTNDEVNQNYALAKYCAGIGAMFQEIEDYARDGVDLNGKHAPGWSSIVDINRTPTKALSWLAQFVGVTTQAGLTDAQQRARIKATDGWNRGTPNAMVAAAQQYLTGTKQVILRERDPAACAAQPAYGISVITRLSETPDQNAVLNALTAQKPAGIVLRYVALAGQDYQSLLTNRSLYSTVFTTYLTYGGVVTDIPGT